MKAACILLCILIITVDLTAQETWTDPLTGITFRQYEHTVKNKKQKCVSIVGYEPSLGGIAVVSGVDGLGDWQGVPPGDCIYRLYATEVHTLKDVKSFFKTEHTGRVEITLMDATFHNVKYPFETKMAYYINFFNAAGLPCPAGTASWGDGINGRSCIAPTDRKKYYSITGNFKNGKPYGPCDVILPDGTHKTIEFVDGIAKDELGFTGEKTTEYPGKLEVPLPIPAMVRATVVQQYENGKPAGGIKAVNYYVLGGPPTDVVTANSGEITINADGSITGNVTQVKYGDKKIIFSGGLVNNKVDGYCQMQTMDFKYGLPAGTIYFSAKNGMVSGYYNCVFSMEIFKDRQVSGTIKEAVPFEKFRDDVRGQFDGKMLSYLSENGLLDGSANNKALDDAVKAIIQQKSNLYYIDRIESAVVTGVSPYTKTFFPNTTRPETYICFFVIPKKYAHNAGAKINVSYYDKAGQQQQVIVNAEPYTDFGNETIGFRIAATLPKDAGTQCCPSYEVIFQRPGYPGDEVPMRLVVEKSQ